jgi:hypothetical protein
MTKALNEQNWDSFNSRLNNNEIVVIDNFFTDEFLSILKIRILYSKYFDTDYVTYAATDYFIDQDYITNTIVKEFRHNLSVLPKFQRAWSFVYNNESTGVGMHADPSQFNVNVWVSGDESVKNKTCNGLLIYKIIPPSDWTRIDWNGPASEVKIKNYIDSHHLEPIKIDYKSNRAIIFNGAYFHKSNNVSMKEGEHNRRVSYTMLFGSQLNEGEEFYKNNN